MKTTFRDRRPDKVFLNISKCSTIVADGIHFWVTSVQWNMRGDVPLIKSVRFIEVTS